MMLINVSLGAGSTLYTLSNKDPVFIYAAFCKLRLYILQSTSMVYRWCLAAACIDRFVSSSTDVRLRNFADVKRARRIILAIVIVWLVLPVHILIFMNLTNGNCAFNIIPASLYHSLSTTVLGVILPVAVMVLCAVLIRRNLVRKRIRQEQQTSQRSEVKDEVTIIRHKRDQQVLFMLLIQASVFVGLTLPLMGVYFYNAVKLYIPNTTADDLAVHRFIRFMGEVVVYIFPVLSFYLYTLASRSYRNELVRLLHSVIIYKCYGNRRRIAPVTHDTGRTKSRGDQLHYTTAKISVVPKIN